MKAVVRITLALLCARALAAQSGTLGIPDSRMGSGTAWVPDATPMQAFHSNLGEWNVMTHGVAFLQYISQRGPRGDSQFGSLNWLMVGASRPAFGGRLGLRGMWSLEPFTLPVRGYPMLLQTGELFDGLPIADAQHPHDMFMEMALTWDRALTDRVGLSIYAAPVGEPVAGPSYFGHRPSAANDPFSPLGHHWQDATHVAFGTATVGIFSKTLRVEASLFNGTEPDQVRTNLDYHDAELNSWATRLSWNPTARWSTAASHAHIIEHEGDELQRTTLSAQYVRPLPNMGTLAVAGIFGQNRENERHATNSWLLEANVDLDMKNAVFGRLEGVTKHRDDLRLPTTRTVGSGGLAPSGIPEHVDVSTFVVGYIRELAQRGGLSYGLGFRAALNVVPDVISQDYGSRTPSGFGVFLRVRPRGAMDHSQHTGK
jgi:hypothetical protein